jgi:tRNA 2-thiouridine synthesizing protein E
MQDSEKPATTMDEILHPGQGSGSSNPDFPDAPNDWQLEQAKQLAADAGLELNSDHLDLIRALQQFFKRHSDASINLRELHDALDERFHSRGGLKFLYEIIPGGPVAQGCELAGLKPPPGSKDLSFGSVV